MTLWLLLVAYGLYLGYLLRPAIDAYLARLRRVEHAVLSLGERAELKAA